LAERAIEHAVLPWCRDHGVALVAYSRFGSGSFPSDSSARGKVLAAVAKSHGATPHQVALAFLLRDRAALAIPKAAKAAHASENGGAGALTLTEAELAQIAAAFPASRPGGSLPML
jgi:diketogulonate reductase-like aldo/keto reductase